MKKIRIIEAGNELGLGGTEYTIQLYSKYLNKDNFDVTVVAIHNGGERVQLIRELGVRVLVLNGNMDKFVELIRETDVFHWHGYGTLDPVLFGHVKANKPRLVLQTNVFGGFSNSSLYEIIDYDLYVSKMILIRRMILDRNVNNLPKSKRKVLYNPVDVSNINNLIPSKSELIRQKKKLDLQKNFIIGRIGRPDDAKFDLITLEAFAAFAAIVPETKFLLVGATSKMLQHAESLNITDRLIIFENTPDLKLLILYYSLMDVFLAASNFGETFGMVIAEAMAVGIPVISIYTPEKDNAQVELVDNTITGLIVERKLEDLVEALLRLYNDEDYRNKLGASAKIKVSTNYKAEEIVGSLEKLIETHLKLLRVNDTKSKLVDFSEALLDDYRRRCSDLWKPS